MMKPQLIIALLIGLCVNSALGKQRNADEYEESTMIVKGAVGAMQSSEYGLMKAADLAGTTSTFGIKKGADWLVRVDGAHPGANYNHLNINSRVSGVRDPHLYLPPGSTSIGAAATTALDAVGKGAYYYAVAADGLRVGGALLEDLDKEGIPSKRTAKAVVKVGASWTGGYYGGVAGSYLGSIVGSGVGAVVGVLCPPCGVAVAVAGTVIGGGMGGATGVAVANSIVDG